MEKLVAGDQMKKYQAIIFDVGDTLVKWHPNWAELYTRRLGKAGVAVDHALGPVISDALYRAEGLQKRREQNGATRLSDDAYYELLDRAALSAVPDLPETIDVLAGKLRDIPLEKQQMRVIPGVPLLLAGLKQAGYRLAVVSNHWAWLMEYLQTEGLAESFETVVISEIAGVAKPDVRIMELALTDLKLPGAACLYVGDQEMDVLCAKTAGLDVAWIAPPEAVLLEDIPYKEDYRIPSVLALPDILLI